MKFSIVVPAYNESENLRLLIPELDKALHSLGEPYEVIVVDNASTDNTQETLARLRERFPSLRVESDPVKGFGKAILTGLAASQGEIIGYIHADNQMMPEEIIRIYQKLIRDNLEVCKATRLDRHDGIRRWVISKGYNFLFRLMFGIRIRDINGSPKLFTRKFFNEAALQSRDWFIDPEIIIKAKRLRVPIAEVEIHTLSRLHGASQVYTLTIFEFLRNMFNYWWQE
ncbi:MAG: Glycosyl transferase family 2 [Candidatus Magasanikbacteria bacterium GW2011_GWA2_45_39]|uniref:Glycosyl transferase family 2 n=1 Tax=Candidatus Magasanikbacteria bacterium GW2011_GWA2_45_39 TaxID=1619041 RepID=A0A0G1MHA4_9BACT|nr:MAG: Glycosyl transferase family 2 [Candidatus Magasanikbacteria bacterium GW2011_GWA2_45_39]